MLGRFALGKRSESRSVLDNETVICPSMSGTSVSCAATWDLLSSSRRSLTVDGVRVEMVDGCDLDSVDRDKDG